MNRRHFLASSAAAVALSTARQAGAAPPDETDALVRELVAANNAHIPELLAKQERRASHPHRGGMADGQGIFTVGASAGLVSALTCAVMAPTSSYRDSAELIEPLRLAVAHLRKLQHDDGTIDLHTTNFHSPPDAAFIVEVVAPACALLRTSAVPAIKAVADELGPFLVRGGEALVAGGVHTPNHRWVVCAGLAWVNALFPNPKCVARIDEWLAEGIDLDPDGQYTEKSTTVYSPIVDRALLTVARLLNRPALLEPVRRNLEMTLYYVHPDGEVVTEASRRQDRYQRGSMARYYYSYRCLALHDGNGRFAAMARQIERTARKQIGDLPALLLEPELRRPLPAEAPLPTDYAKVFSHSALARVRRGPASATILANNATLFSFRKGAAALEAVRFASAFFGKGQFEGAALEVRDGAYMLRQELEGPYFQPLTREQIAAGDHVKMAPNGTLANSRDARKRSNVQRLISTCTVRERAEMRGTFELVIDIRGTDRVPVAVELAFRAGGVLEGIEAVAGVKDAFVLRGERGRYTADGQTIEFGPGRADHTYTQIRGALPKWEGQSVYMTGFTPFQSTLRIS